MTAVNITAIISHGGFSADLIGADDGNVGVTELWSVSDVLVGIVVGVDNAVAVTLCVAVAAGVDVATGVGCAMY